MNMSFLISTKNSASVSIHLTAIRLLSIVLFCFLFANELYAQGTNCTTATPLTINGACGSGTINDRVQHAPSVNGCSFRNFRREGWYTFSVTGGPLRIEITGVSTNRNLFLQLISSTASCTGLSQINCANTNNNNNSSQTETINTTLSDGIYYIKVVNIGSNGDMNLTSICVTATPTISSFTPNSGCSNVTPVVITGTNFTAVTAVRFGGTNADSFVVNSATQITAIPAAVSSGVISVVTGLGTATSSSNFTLSTSPSVPIIGAITNPNCTTNTGSVVLNGLPASGTLNQTGTVVTSYAITGISMTISGLAAGTYNFTVTNNTLGCTSTTSPDVIINSAINTWNGMWSNGTPNNAQSLIFAADYSSSSDLSGCSCQVNSGVNVLFNAPHTLTITNSIAVLGSGNLTFAYDNTFGVRPISSASLVQINNVANSGNIKFQRRTNTNVISTDYTYWSSPVSGQTMNALSPNSLPSMFYSYKVTATNENWQQESSAITMVPGLGYSIGGPNVLTPPDTYLATFIGVPNNGIIRLSNVFENKSYLLGNPYPSAIDADTFLTQNASVLGGTLYFWTHNTAIQDRNNIISTAGTGQLAYTSDDYATYNITGGVGIDFGSSTSAALNSGANTSIPSGKIAAGQGFFASTQLTIPSGSSIEFNNSMRLAGVTAGVSNNDQFFKTKDPLSKALNSTEKHRVWLNLYNTQGAFKQTLIGYITNATNQYDTRFDGESFDANEFIDFYSINSNKKLVIQGRALPFDENDKIPLGYRSSIDGDFTISVGEKDGKLNNQAIYIEDKLTNIIFDLSKGKYTFKTQKGIFDDRFVLRYNDNNATLNTIENKAVDHEVVVSNKDKKIKIESFVDNINRVTIFDEAGRLIFQKEKVDSKELLISNLAVSQQLLIVKTILQNGKTISKKLIY